MEKKMDTFFFNLTKMLPVYLMFLIVWELFAEALERVKSPTRPVNGKRWNGRTVWKIFEFSRLSNYSNLEKWNRLGTMWKCNIFQWFQSNRWIDQTWRWTVAILLVEMEAKIRNFQVGLFFRIVRIRIDWAQCENVTFSDDFKATATSGSIKRGVEQSPYWWCKWRQNFSIFKLGYFFELRKSESIGHSVKTQNFWKLTAGFASNAEVK